MKNLFISLALFTALVFIVSCGDSNTEGNVATSETTCTHDGAFSCKENAVLKCENKEWQKIEQCTEDQKCNPVKGICETVSENGDTASDADTDEPDTTPDNPDTDDADTTPDSGDSQPDADQDNDPDATDNDADTTQDNPDADDSDTEPTTEPTDEPTEDPTSDDDEPQGVIEINDEETCVASGGIWNSGKCTKSVNCIGLPENAVWNKASGIRQTWNGTEWVPSEIGSYSATSSTSECVFKCKTNYEWNTETATCDAATRTVDCIDLPANAVWNSVSSINQTWNGSDWTPTSTSSYDTTESTTECRFKCKEHYTWNGLLCVADTKEEDCSAKPEENTVWNDNDRNGKFTQTWNGTNWAPASYASTFNKTAGICTYICTMGYFWNGSACETAPTQSANCSGLPVNAQWNTASSITQTWNGSEWYPSTAGVYNTTASTSECRYKCADGYHTENSGASCISNTKTGVACTGLPANAQWNTASSITQTWNGSSWQPSVAGSFNNTASSSECRFKCNTNYNWNSTNKTCDAAKQTVNCTEKPANTVWNTVSTVTQTWTGSAWSPSNTSTYNTTSSMNECRYKCASGFEWNGSQCILPPSLGNICTHQTKCYNDSSSITCPSSSTADFFGQDAYYAAQGLCTPQSFTVQTLSSQKVVLDNNTGLMWQRTIPTSTYTWTNAVSYCDGLSYAGYSDWRLPTPQELLTIADNSRTYPGVNTTYFPNMPTTYTFIWTSEKYFGNTSNAYAFGTYSGWINDQATKTTVYSVMCVRGNALLEPVFTIQTISGDVVVKDSTTGLMWQKTYQSSMTWVNALKYCEDLTYAGYSDWRLPNKNELASLLDYDKTAAPCSNFPDMPAYSELWSSSTDVNNINRAWRVYFYSGRIDHSIKTDPHPVRCVR